MITNLVNQIAMTNAANEIVHFRFGSDVLFIMQAAAGLLQNPVVSATAPASPANGDDWLDVSGPASTVPATAAGIWKQYDGTAFVAAPTIEQRLSGLSEVQSLEAADIAARDALTVNGGDFVYVSDASADATVDSGGALYRRNTANTAYTKLAEFESMDLTMTSPTQLAVV